jgi:hypothetical protein
MMRNMSIRKGLVKNAWLIIEHLHDHYIQVQVIDNRSGLLGEPQCIPRIRFQFTPSYSSWTVHRVQYPLQLAYTTTFNGCSGLTLDKSIIDLQTEVFAHGQLYTALSRVRHHDDSRVLFDNDNSDDMTTNIVYKDLLL